MIDPKGDLVSDLLARLPQHAGPRLVLFDPDDAGPPPVLNVLAGPDPGRTVDNLVGIFGQIFADSWGPRTDDILRAACLTLRPLPGSTLADIPRLLGEHDFRTAALTAVHDEVLAGFWAWYTRLSPAGRAQVSGPLLNKLRAFLLRPYVRAIVGRPAPGIQFDRLLDSGGICLARLPKGILGQDTCRLLGSMILAKVWEAATGRARQPEHARRDAAVYLDECQNFLTLPTGLADMAAEARAYHLSLVLAHQNLAQLPSAIREAISANARNKLFFTLSPEDARTLARHTAPNLSDHDLSHLGAYQAAARIMTGATPTPAFTLTTTPLPAPTPSRATALRRAARADTPQVGADTPPESADDPAPTPHL